MQYGRVMVMERTHFSARCTTLTEAKFQLFVNETCIQVNRTYRKTRAGEDIINEWHIELLFTCSFRNLIEIPSIDTIVIGQSASEIEYISFKLFSALNLISGEFICLIFQPASTIQAAQEFKNTRTFQLFCSIQNKIIWKASLARKCNIERRMEFHHDWALSAPYWTKQGKQWSEKKI